MHDLLLTPIVFLLTAVLLVPLAQRFGLGSVLGYLLGGCIIGPWGLALVKNIDIISHVAEIGVVLMLFLIGLELQPRKLLEMRTIVFELRSRGVEMIERETFESALLIGEKALMQMGIDAELARLARNRFREHNLATLDAMLPYFRDDVQTISIAQTAREALAKSFEQDWIRIREGKGVD